MNHAYVSPTLDEKVVIAQARDKSKRHPKWNPDGDAVQVHYHPAAEQCDSKTRHLIFQDGYEHVLNQGGAALCRRMTT
jgi:hypothetical protein